MIKGMDTQKTASLIERLAQNIAKIRYGTVSVTLKIHDGRVVDITHSVTEKSH